MRAVRVHELGPPEVMRYEEVPAPEPKPGEVLVRIAAAGVNYLDVYYRSGFHWGGHHKRALPYIPGAEAAGTVVGIGAGVNNVQVGDRVAYGVSNGYGSYAEFYSLPAWHLYKLPSGISFETAAATMQQGMTAHYLTHSTYVLKSGETVLVHAAAGGTGLLLVQIAKMLGARVFGTVSTPERAALVAEAGADAVINYVKQDFAAEVRRLTGGTGVNVVYDSVGKATFEKDFDCLAPLAMTFNLQRDARARGSSSRGAKRRSDLDGAVERQTAAAVASRLFEGQPRRRGRRFITIGVLGGDGASGREQRRQPTDRYPRRP